MRKALFAPALAVLCAGFASARDPACPYTAASLQGPDSVVLTYGAHVAKGLHAEALDGKGNLTRTGVINQPTAGSATGARTVVSVTRIGTYKVNCDGTGTFNRVVTLPDGSKATSSDDFIVTSAMKIDSRLVATTISDAQRDPASSSLAACL